MPAVMRGTPASTDGAVPRDATPRATPPPGSYQRWRLPVLILAVGAAYAAGAACSWLLFHAAEVAVFYPPAGVTLGALLLTDRRRWPWILGTVAAVELVADVWQGLTIWPSVGFAVANTAEPLLGALLFRRFHRGRIDLNRPSDAGTFIGCCVVAGPLLGAAIGSATIALGLGRSLSGAFLPYWAGDALAVLTLGAAVTAYGSVGRALGWRGAFRAAAVVALTGLLTFVGFWPQQVPLAYLPLPVLVAAAFGGRVPTVAAAGFVMAFVANMVSGSGRGQWARLAIEPRPEAASLQVYLAVAILTAGALAVGIAERDRARRTTAREVAARRRMQALQDVTAGLATAATSQQIATVLAEWGFRSVADHGVVALLDPDAGCLRAVPSGSLSAVLGDSLLTEIPISEADRFPVTTAAVTGRTIVLGSVAELAERFPHAVDSHVQAGTRSMIAVPIRIGERRCGALAFLFTTDGGADPEVASVAGTLAELAGQALERAELYEAEHKAAHQLQHALLPQIAAEIPGVGAGVSYRPAQIGHDVGGDWYDVFELPGNKVGFVVGDVVGHDLRAATTMGQLQTLLRTVAQTGATPAEVLEALDEACARIDGADCSTVGYAEYSPGDRTLRYACAGHPPPLLVDGGLATFLRGGRSQPLGFALRPRAEAVVPAPEGAMLVWYSDGLIERRDERLDVGLDRLAGFAAQLTGSDAQLWSDTLLAEMTAGHTAEDDVVVACLRLQESPAPAGSEVLRCTLRDSGQLAGTRRQLRAWTTEQRMSAAQTDALLLICTEALTNALGHSRSGHDAPAAELVVTRADLSHVRVEVTDQGRWRPSAGDGSQNGRGLTVISRLAQRVTIDMRESGTRLTATLSTT